MERMYVRTCTCTCACLWIQVVPTCTFCVVKRLSMGCGYIQFIQSPPTIVSMAAYYTTRICIYTLLMSAQSHSRTVCGWHFLILIWILIHTVQTPHKGQSPEITRVWDQDCEIVKPRHFFEVWNRDWNEWGMELGLECQFMQPHNGLRQYTYMYHRGECRGCRYGDLNQCRQWGILRWGEDLVTTYHHPSLAYYNMYIPTTYMYMYNLYYCTCIYVHVHVGPLSLYMYIHVHTYM